ncbi:hypothetical protein DM02DRAFT_618975 [Periconia macrospinosa]|uniref:Uncharacterized protein n=1 Tax=Periconia macrospinosa TaxID=97972 RepID=A0A2V1D9L8_9PLEO|nr:hypothetical protein DM02DRAFT_618975 [Periconia macrospinosa]
MNRLHHSSDASLNSKPAMVAMVIPNTPENRKIPGASVANLADLLTTALSLDGTKPSHKAVPPPNEYTPTTQDIIREAVLAKSTDREFMNGIDAKNINEFGRYLFRKRKWAVSHDRLRTLFLESVILVTFGEIPLPQSKGLGNRKPPSKLKVRAHNAGKVAETQKEKTTVLVAIKSDPFVKSTMEFKFTMYHKDDSIADAQPKHVAYVNVTHRNARESKPSSNIPGAFQDLHHCIDVTNEIGHLKMIFGSSPGGYFEALCRGVKNEDKNNKISLIVTPHTYPFASNLFIGKRNMSLSHIALVDTLKQATYIFSLIRASDVPKKVQGLWNRFVEEDSRDPLNALFVNPENPQLSDKGIREKNDFPKFDAKACKYFDTWIDLQRIVGISSILERRFHSRSRTYTGKASVIPLANTYAESVELFMHYTIFLSPDNTNEVLPAPKEGTSVKICFDKSMNGYGHWWNGTITRPTVGSGKNQITMIAQRPLCKDNRLNHPSVIADEMEISTLDKDKVGCIDAVKLQCEIQEHQREITVCVLSDYQEMKRIVGNLHSLHTSPIIPNLFPVQHRLQLEYKTLLIGQAYDKLSKSNLYSGMREVEYAKAFLRNILHPHQMAIIDRLMANGMVARFAAVHGASKSGKTTTMLSATLPYLLSVEYSSEELVELHRTVRGFYEIRWEDGLKKESRDWDKYLMANTRQMPDELHETPVFIEPIGPCLPALPSTNAPMFVKGKVTVCALRNDTVDKVFNLFKPIAKRFAKHLGCSKFLGFRMHSLSLETQAIIAMTHPFFDMDDLPELPDFFNDQESSDEVTTKHSESCIQAVNGSQWQDIRDRRFKSIKNSMAYGVMQLAGIYPRSKAMKAAFTEKELEHAEDALSALPNARAEIYHADGEMSKAKERMIRAAAEIGLLYLIENASYILTTISNATQFSFNAVRMSSAIACDEAGRVNDAEFMGLFGHYPFAKLHIANGCLNESPMMFAPSSENPFRKQGLVSTLARLVETGFPVHELKKQ